MSFWFTGQTLSSRCKVLLSIRSDATPKQCLYQLKKFIKAHRNCRGKGDLFSQLLTEFLFWRTSSTVLYYASTVWAFFRKLISNVSTRQGNCWGRQIHDKCNTSLLCQSQTIDLLAVDICITCAEFKHQFLYQSDPTVLSSPWRSPQVKDSTAAFSGRAWPHPIRSEA